MYFLQMYLSGWLSLPLGEKPSVVYCGVSPADAVALCLTPRLGVPHSCGCGSRLQHPPLLLSGAEGGNNHV